MMEMLFSKSKTTFKGRYMTTIFWQRQKTVQKLRQMQLFILIELKHLCYKPLLFFKYHCLNYVKYFLVLAQKNNNDNNDNHTLFKE